MFTVPVLPSAASDDSGLNAMPFVACSTIKCEVPVSAIVRQLRCTLPIFFVPSKSKKVNDSKPGDSLVTVKGLKLVNPESLLLNRPLAESNTAAVGFPNSHVPVKCPILLLLLSKTSAS